MTAFVPDADLPDGPGGALLWDVGFLLSGVVFLVSGYLVVRTDGAASPPSHGGCRND
ncbi:hypothetical protein OB905_08040 [Halobacteria archaeon AArc-dxtr1]|nr:hypothetical protein [Halobacteria archaeon AArc-dxtr1]